LSVLSVVAIVGIVVCMGIFALDAIEVRSMMRKEFATSWTVATMTALMKYLLAIAALVGFALAGFKSPKAAKAAAQGRSSGLIVGRGRRSAPASQEGVGAKPTS